MCLFVMPTFSVLQRDIVFIKFLMQHEVSPYLGLNMIRTPNPIIIFIIISYLFNDNFWIYVLGSSIDVYK